MSNSQRSAADKSSVRFAWTGVGLIEVPSRAKVARHEAGHAVVALCLKCVVGDVEILSSGAGQAFIEPNVDPEVNGVIAWAGAAAVGDNMLHDEDTHTIKVLIDSFDYDNADIARCRWMALGFVKAVEAAIDAVAAELDRNGKLSGERLWTIATEALPVDFRRNVEPFDLVAVDSLMTQARAELAPRPRKSAKPSNKSSKTQPRHDSDEVFERVTKAFNRHLDSIGAIPTQPSRGRSGFMSGEHRDVYVLRNVNGDLAHYMVPETGRIRRLDYEAFAKRSA